MSSSIFVNGISVHSVGDQVSINIIIDGEIINILSLKVKDDSPLRVSLAAEELHSIVENYKCEPRQDETLRERFETVFNSNQDDVLELLNSLETAWGIIANAESRLWALPQDTNNVWINAARKWRDEDWHGALNKHMKNKNEVDSRIEPPELGGDS